MMLVLVLLVITETLSLLTVGGCWWLSRRPARAVQAAERQTVDEVWAYARAFGNTPRGSGAPR